MGVWVQEQSLAQVCGTRSRWAWAHYGLELLAAQFVWGLTGFRGSWRRAPVQRSGLWREVVPGAVAGGPGDLCHLEVVCLDLVRGTQVLLSRKSSSAEGALKKSPPLALKHMHLPPHENGTQVLQLKCHRCDE